MKLLPLIFTLFFLSGCADYREPDSYPVARGLIFDMEDDKIIMTADFAVTERIFTVEDQSVELCADKMSAELGEQILWSHTNTVALLSQDTMLTDGIKEWVTSTFGPELDVKLCVISGETDTVDFMQLEKILIDKGRFIPYYTDGEVLPNVEILKDGGMKLVYQ